MTGADAEARLAMIAVSELSGELNFDRRCVSRLGTDELADAECLRLLPEYGGQRLRRRGKGH